MGEKNSWRGRLRGDPANWLLDANANPSVAFWFLHDIVGRPEDAPAMLELRERILFSQIVQDLFAAQNELGFWNNPHWLDEPRHQATLWALAGLAELGIPRNSRRARAACEFALDNLNLADNSFLGLLAHSLAYFNYLHDKRLKKLLDAITPDAESGNVFALWALAEHGISKDGSDQEMSLALECGTEALLDAMAHNEYQTVGAFPSFDPRDMLLALRVLGELNRLKNEPARSAIERIWSRQSENARWELEKSYDGWSAAPMEIAQTPSRWATLNVLRVITKI